MGNLYHFLFSIRLYEICILHMLNYNQFVLFSSVSVKGNQKPQQCCK